MALLLIVLALLTFGVFGVSSGSTGAGSGTHQFTPHRVKCSARMKAQMSSGEGRRKNCGGPPANP